MCRATRAASALLLAVGLTVGCGERPPETSWRRPSGGKADTCGDGSVVEASAAPDAQSDSSDTDASGTVPFEVTIKGLRNAKGVVRISICDNPVCYEDQSGFRFEKNKPSDTAGVSFLFPVPPGDYVVLMFHDEDGDDEFDTNFFGWPKEGFGFSNDVKPGLSAPPYEKVVVHVGPSGLAIIVNVQYM